MKVQQTLAVDNKVNDDKSSGRWPSTTRLTTRVKPSGRWPSTVRLTKKAQLTLAVNDKVDESKSS